MNASAYFELPDETLQWHSNILAEHLDEAEVVAKSLLASADEDENGCLLTPTKGPRKVRFRDRQVRAYRFVFVVINREPLSSTDQLLHSCNNRCCINPDHLRVGDHAENRRDYRTARAYGIDPNYL
jgi:hypothetical protein